MIYLMLRNFEGNVQCKKDPTGRLERKEFETIIIFGFYDAEYLVNTLCMLICRFEKRGL